MKGMFIVYALTPQGITKAKFLVRDARDALDAMSEVSLLNMNETADGEPMYPASCILSAEPVEFECGKVLML